MTGDRQKFGDLQTVELDNALSGTAPSGLPVRLSPRLVWRLALGLMIVSGALALVASFAPWAIGRFTPYLAAMGFGLTPMNDPTLTALADLVLRSLRPPTNQFTLAWLIVAYVILAGQILYAGLGAFIGVALSFHLQERARRVLLRVYGAWLATLLIRLMICTALLAVDARNVFASIEQIAPGGLASVAPAGGYWLAWLAAALSRWLS